MPPPTLFLKKVNGRMIGVHAANPTRSQGQPASVRTQASSDKLASQSLAQEQRLLENEQVRAVDQPFSDANMSGFSFGQPASTGSNTGSVFGTTGPSTSGKAPAFGSNTSQGAGSGLFGSTAPTTSSGSGGSGLFGSTPAATSSTGGGGGSSNLFGGGANSGLSVFGSGSQTPSNNGASGVFGSGTITPSGQAAKPPLGNISATSGAPAASTLGSTATSATQSKPLFGAWSGATGGGEQKSNVFGSGSAAGAIQTAPVTTGSIFGNKANVPSSSSGGFTLGASTTSTSGAPSFSFPSATTPATGATSTSEQHSSNSAFSFPKQNNLTPQGQKQGSSLFSTTPAGNPPTFNALGSKDSTQIAQSNTSAGGATTSTSGGSSLFKGLGSSNTPASGPAFSLGSTTQTSAAPSSALFSGLGSTSQPTTQASSSNTAAPSLTFAVPNTSTATTQSSTTTTSAPTLGSNLFSSASTQPTTTSAAPVAGFSLGGTGNAQPSTTTATSGSSLFGATTAAPQASKGTSAASTAPTAGPSTAAAASAVGGASTSGPAPPAQSRLAAKTVDEIITSWSTSLNTHQKTFQSLAKQVSSWDRALVENGTKISQLYGRCFQAERDCTEVERQLSNVEHSQLELEKLLDHYEGEVDRLMDQAGLGGGGSGVSGVDAERERTYKSAEQCASRLTEMGQSLTSMIDEINDASGKLSSANPNAQAGAKADDPLSQIVRVLNQHLAQLQTIDSGAAALQSRVSTAQREARTLGQNHGVNGDARALDGFGRSYLGRT